jgi:hypothetical protein
MTSTAFLLTVPPIIVVVLAEIAKSLIKRSVLTSQASPGTPLTVIEAPPDSESPPPIAERLPESVSQASQAA